jgi:hypothetical protein
MTFQGSSGLISAFVIDVFDTSMLCSSLDYLSFFSTIFVDERQDCREETRLLSTIRTREEEEEEEEKQKSKPTKKRSLVANTCFLR